MTESGSMPRAQHVPLARVRDGRYIAGVCGGLAAHLGLPVIWVRIAMLIFTMFGGAGALFYAWLWVTVPSIDSTGPDDIGNGVQRMRRALTRGPVPPPVASVPVSPAPAAPPAPPAQFSSSGLPSATSASTVASASTTTSASTAASPSTTTSTSSPNSQLSQPSVPAMATSPGKAAPTWQPADGAPPVDATTHEGSASNATSSGPAQPAQPNFRRWPVAELLLGGALLVAGIGLVLTQLGVELDLAVLLPAMVVLVGVGLTWWQIADRNRPERNLLPRVLGALALVAVGVLTFFVTASQPSVFTVVAAALAVLAGVALALAPWLLRVNRELINERSARAREAERSDIAAHLHDSVLQTLAAIQQRSEPGSDVARLARGQERELREWLFRGADGAGAPAREAVDVELRAHAAALEAEYPVRFEVVSVGSSVVGSGAVGANSDQREGSVVPEPVVAAAREAMLNAAKHAEGEVSVYIELTPGKASVDVTDRGPGLGAAFDSPGTRTLDTDELPDGRMGVRESIIGRMERAGGVANLVPGPGGSGTSVRLSMPLPEPARDVE